MGATVDASVAGTAAVVINAPRERWLLSMGVLLRWGEVDGFGHQPRRGEGRGKLARDVAPPVGTSRLSGGPDETAQVLAVDADLHTAARLLSEGVKDRLRR